MDIFSVFVYVLVKSFNHLGIRWSIAACEIYQFYCINIQATCLLLKKKVCIIQAIRMHMLFIHLFMGGKLGGRAKIDAIKRNMHQGSFQAGVQRYPPGPEDVNA